MAKRPLRDLVVVLPGITGSVLRNDGREVWGLSAATIWSGLRTRGGSLQDLRLDGFDSDKVVADRLMPDAHLVPGLVKIDGYSALGNMIRNSFEVVTGANYLEFPYDWRLDNRVAAHHLSEVVRTALGQWRNHSGNPDARVILLAHSMGGLVARYYLEVLDGWRDCRVLITFGTPFRGALNALDYLANGYKKLVVDLTEVMRTFPSVHQLLPIYKALRIGDEFVRVAETGRVPGVNPALAEDGLAFHREIEAKVAVHRNNDDYQRNGYVVVPVVGIHQKTQQSALLADGRVIVTRDLPDWIDPALGDGDGTVPRASAIPIELSGAFRDSYIAERHGSLHCNRTVLTDIRARLEQSQVVGIGKIREPEPSAGVAARSAISVDLDDLYLPGEPVTLQAELVNVSSPGALWAEISPVDRAGEAVRQEFGPVPGGWQVELTDLPPGLYRATVRSRDAGPFAPLPVHDLFAVAADEPG